MTSPSILKTYATATAATSYSKKEQAIIVESKDGLSIKDYVTAIGALTKPTDIRFISRISNGRICVFLASNEIANNLTENHKTLTIQDHILEIRPLISKLKRIIISNVCPVIPHEIIEGELTKLSIQPASKISYLRAGLSDPGFSHVLSFRRQVFINPADLDKLPESILTAYDDTTYRIYLASESASCYLCKQTGHIARQCESNIEKSGATTNPNTNTNIPSINIPTQNTTKALTDTPTVAPQVTPNLEVFPDINTTQKWKRQLSTSTASNEGLDFRKNDTTANTATENLTDITAESSYRKYIPKKAKRSNSKEKYIPSLDTLLEPAKDFIEKSPEFALNYSQFKNFIENCQGSQNIIQVANDYTSNPTNITSMIESIYPHLNDRKIKNRLTRIVNKLKGTTALPNMETETQTTSQQYLTKQTDPTNLETDSE